MSIGEASSVVVRPARPEDAETLAEVHVRAWQAAYRGLMPDDLLDGLDPVQRSVPWRAHLVDFVTGDGPSTILAGTRAGRVVGFVVFGTVREGVDDARRGADRAGGEVYALNVHPDCWSAGVGSALLVAAHDGLATAGFSSATLWVVTGNTRARRFYERHGWTPDQVSRTEDVRGAAVPEVRYARSLP